MHVLIPYKPKIWDWTNPAVIYYNSCHRTIHHSLLTSVVWCRALFKWGFWYLKMTCVGHKMKEDENLGWTIQNNKQRTEKVKKRTQAGRVEWSRESRMFTCCKRVFTFSYADATVSSWCSGRARKMVPTVLYCSLVSRFQNQYWDQHSNGVK